MPTRGRSRQRSRGTRAKYFWQQTFVTHVMLSTGNQVHTDISHKMIVDGTEPGGTCRRLILDARVLASDTAGDAVLGVGVVVTTQDAVASGVIPNPVDNSRQDWYYWKGFPMVGVSSGLVAGDGSNPFWSTDIRTARKLREKYALVLTTVSKPTSTQPFVVHYAVRTLWTLP